MDTLGNLRTFVAVANFGGFSEAARRLHVVPSVVAKRIDQLEQTLGTRLFERSTRAMTITEAGQQLKARASGLLADFDELVGAVQRDDSKLEGHIRMMAPTTLTMLRLGQVVAQFMQKHERITVELSLVDLSSNPEEGGYDLAVSGRTASYDGVVDVPLCSTHPLLLAAPAYLRAQGTPAHPRELVGHTCLVFGPSGRRWNFQSPRGVLGVEVTPRLTADDNLTLLHAAQDGMGIAVLPRYVAEPALRQRRLRPLLPGFPVQDTWFRAYVPKRRLRLARVQALVDHLAQAFSEAQWKAPPGGPG